jgi:hypothetical protein
MSSHATVAHDLEYKFVLFLMASIPSAVSAHQGNKFQILSKDSKIYKKLMEEFPEWLPAQDSECVPMCFLVKDFC